MFTPFSDADVDRLATQHIAIVHPTLNDLPKSARGYAANNMYPGFPPLMNDGRALIASWQPEAITNNILLKANGIKSNWEYRRYLTHNAKDIIRRDFQEAANDVGYYDLGMNEVNNTAFLPIFAGIPKKHANPAMYQSYAEPEHVYGKFDSDLKADYLSREQLAARMVTPVVTQADLLKLRQ
jgi:hypothetical protein